LTIYGDGSYTRSLCYVDDLLAGIVAVMETNRADAPGRPYNLGNPEEHSILEYAKLVIELIPSSTSEISFLPPVPDDPSRRKPDIQRAHSELDWEPRVLLRDGLTRTIEYFREVTAAR
jgi:nucleoside-diphosphate-sugar epimerase